MKKILISFTILSLFFPILSANAMKKKSNSSPCPDTVRQGTAVATHCAGVTIVCPQVAVEGANVSARCTSTGLTTICPPHSNNPSGACAYISTQPKPSTSGNRITESVTVSPKQCSINEAQLIKKCTTCTTTCAATTRKITPKDVPKHSSSDGQDDFSPPPSYGPGSPSYGRDRSGPTSTGSGFIGSDPGGLDGSGSDGSSSDGSSSGNSSGNSSGGLNDPGGLDGGSDPGDSTGGPW